ncbi:long-chain fatty acid-CoA ligase, partial [Serendipita sp. 397]
MSFLSPTKSRFPAPDRSRFPPGAGSVYISEPENKNETGIRRAAHTKDRLLTEPYDGVNTIPDILDYSARMHGERQAMGWRDIVEVVEEEKEVTKTVDGKETKQMKKWKYFKLSEYKYINYIELRQRAIDIANGLLQLGVGKGEVWNIYASTGATWQFMQHGCALISVPIATAYDTLGEEGLTHSLNEPECVGVFTNADLLPVLASVLQKTPTVRYVVYDGEPSQAVLDKIKAATEDREVKVMTLEQLRESGKGKPELPADRRPKTEDMMCIMYTSGTTGNPKGVIIPHSMICASLAGIMSLLYPVFAPEEDSFLAFLPLAHILEYIVEMLMQLIGCKIGYGRIKTLTDMSVRGCLGDLREFKPTIMIGVPAIWETIRKGIISKVKKMGSLKKSVFDVGMTVKRAQLPILTDLVDN